MKSPLDVLDAYAEAFRDLINAKVWSGRKTIRELLRLNKERDWGFLCSSMDIVGDASAAIRHFLQFGLNGPTKYEDIGEAYLRLYGLLSAAYIQQQAVLKMFELMNVPNPRNFRRELDGLEIRDLRHRLASHGTDYANRATQSTETYVPIRIGVGGYGCTYTNNETSQHRTVNLEDALKSHCELLAETIDTIYEKAIRTLYKGQTKKLQEAEKRLEDLRTAKDGGLVVRFPKGGKLVIHTAAPRNLTSRSTRTRRRRRAG